MRGAYGRQLPIFAVAPVGAPAALLDELAVHEGQEPALVNLGLAERRSERLLDDLERGARRGEKAEWRYALTGVGATIAPGSQRNVGYCADLVNAPTRIRPRAIPTGGPLGGFATISLMRYVPAACPRTTNPASIASAPALVTSSAWNAAARALPSVCVLPISRNDVTAVNSQNPYSTIRLSASTSPNIDPAKNVSRATSRPRSTRPAGK